MRGKQAQSGDNVIEFHGPRPAEQPEEPHLGAVHEDVGQHVVPSATVLKADQGIINTGTVHGGQHLTVTERVWRPAPGADGDI